MPTPIGPIRPGMPEGHDYHPKLFGVLPGHKEYTDHQLTSSDPSDLFLAKTCEKTFSQYRKPIIGEHKIQTVEFPAEPETTLQPIQDIKKIDSDLQVIKDIAKLKSNEITENIDNMQLISSISEPVENLVGRALSHASDLISTGAGSAWYAAGLNDLSTELWAASVFVYTPVALTNLTTGVVTLIAQKKAKKCLSQAKLMLKSLENKRNRQPESHELDDVIATLKRTVSEVDSEIKKMGSKQDLIDKIISAGLNASSALATGVKFILKLRHGSQAAITGLWWVSAVLGSAAYAYDTVVSTKKTFTQKKYLDEIKKGEGVISSPEVVDKAIDRSKAAFDALKVKHQEDFKAVHREACTKGTLSEAKQHLKENGIDLGEMEERFGVEVTKLADLQSMNVKGHLLDMYARNKQSLDMSIKNACRANIISKQKVQSKFLRFDILNSVANLATTLGWTILVSIKAAAIGGMVTGTIVSSIFTPVGPALFAAGVLLIAVGFGYAYYKNPNLVKTMVKSSVGYLKAAIPAKITNIRVKLAKWQSDRAQKQHDLQIVKFVELKNKESLSDKEKEKLGKYEMRMEEVKENVEKRGRALFDIEQKLEKREAKLEPYKMRFNAMEMLDYLHNIERGGGQPFSLSQIEDALDVLAEEDRGPVELFGITAEDDFDTVKQKFKEKGIDLDNQARVGRVRPITSFEDFGDSRVRALVIEQYIMGPLYDHMASAMVNGDLGEDSQKFIEEHLGIHLREKMSSSDKDKGKLSEEIADGMRKFVDFSDISPAKQFANRRYMGGYGTGDTIAA